MTDELDQKRNNNKNFPNAFITYTAGTAALPDILYCHNCRRFFASATTASNDLKTHMNVIHGYKTS